MDLDSGEYSFQVRPGSEGPATASCEFKVWLPEIKVTSAYPSPSSSQIQQFDFDLPGWDATAECHLSQLSSTSGEGSTAWLVGFPSYRFSLEAWFPCASPVVYAGVDPGEWEFSVRLHTLEGNRIGRVMTKRFEVALDDKKYARIVGGPYGPTGSNDVEYTLVAVRGPHGDRVGKTGFTCTLATIDGVAKVATGVDMCKFDDLS